MNRIGTIFWMIPLLPLAAAGIIAIMPRRARRPAQGLAIGAMAGALVLSLAAFVGTLENAAAAHGGEGPVRVVLNFDWFRLGTGAVRLGLVLDPLGAVMLVMVSLVGLAIFVFSTGYMAHDANATRFFGFLALFAAAMLGLVMANSLLLFFACWEVMGVASYLLIGFWFRKPSAAAAAKKAFIVTRIGDLGLFLGLLWLYGETGTLLFHDGGRGCLEAAALGQLGTNLAAGSLSVGSAIGFLLFIGAIGKSGQLPLHVWLPDAMEGPTPVSALIHAATMVAAGVFLVARTFPLMAGGALGGVPAAGSPVLTTVTAVGSVTAVFAALIAVAQTDIKRILAYSTVSQLGYMFLGLGTGGVAVGMFHLLTHAFFKALLFLGAGSVIHGCHEEQDIRRMGGLRRPMPLTFATYAAGMMALAGVPLVFSGFWSKDEILHAAWNWGPSRWPFVLGVFGAFLTAFYMTRQVSEVFLGTHRGGGGASGGHERAGAHPAGGVHESPRVMTGPLVVLAFFAVVLGFLGTPVWPWFEGYLAGHAVEADFGRLAHALPVMGLSTAVVGAGIFLGWRFYGRNPRTDAAAPDVLEVRFPKAYRALAARLWVDEWYDLTVVRAHRMAAVLGSWMDRFLIGGLVSGAGWLTTGLAWGAKWMDEIFVNPGFDAGCETVGWTGRVLSRFQNGRPQRYLTLLGLGMAVLVIVILWGPGGGAR